MNHSASSRAAIAAGSSYASHRITRITPSPPIPARRSHRAATSSPEREPCTLPSGSGSSTKSFSVPCPLRKAKVLLTISGYRARRHETVGALWQRVRHGEQVADVDARWGPGDLCGLRRPADLRARRGRRRVLLYDVRRVGACLLYTS